jgi:hypothetical protein
MSAMCCRSATREDEENNAEEFKEWIRRNYGK